MTHSIAISDEVIMNKIYHIRGKKAMIDRDLAEMFGVETKRLKEAVRRNFERFPEDFMFEMTEEEFENWRTQFATSNSIRMGLRYPPFCFTEQGVAMLSCVLNSPQAIAVSIQIIRVFSKMREMLLSNKDILLRLSKIEKRMMKVEGKASKYDDDIQMIFEALKELMNPSQPPRKRIGYRLNNDD
jgi:ORF6N domain